MIIGIGVDIVRISRIEDILSRHGNRFLEKFFPCEVGYDITAERVAGWFALKEAYMKAVGKGMSGVPFSSICIKYDEFGKPHIYGDVVMDHYRVHISISHEREYAVAMVVIEEA